MIISVGIAVVEISIAESASVDVGPSKNSVFWVFQKFKVTICFVDSFFAWKIKLSTKFIEFSFAGIFDFCNVYGV